MCIIKKYQDFQEFKRNRNKFTYNERQLIINQFEKELYEENIAISLQ